MYHYSQSSEKNLTTCTTGIRLVFRTLLETTDHSVVCGHRGPREQKTAFESGASEKEYPDSTHNIYPSKGVDVYPYPLPKWSDSGAFYMFVGEVKRVAKSLGIKIRCGADWDMDGKTDDQKFNDLCHFEEV